MLSIKGGHVEVAQKRRSSYGGAISSSPASELANTTSTGAAKSSGANRQQVHEKVTTASYLAPGKQMGGNVRLLPILLLIVIVMLARQCTARSFLGIDAGNSNQFQGTPMESYNNPADKQQQQQQQETSMASVATFAPADIEYVIELGCRNLVESILNPQRVQPKDQHAALEFIEFMDGDRNKRFSPKHTPRFGR